MVVMTLRLVCGRFRSLLVMFVWPFALLLTTRVQSDTSVVVAPVFIVVVALRSQEVATARLQRQLFRALVVTMPIKPLKAADFCLLWLQVGRNSWKSLPWLS